MRACRRVITEGGRENQTRAEARNQTPNTRCLPFLSSLLSSLPIYLVQDPVKYSRSLYIKLLIPLKASTMKGALEVMTRGQEEGEQEHEG